LGGNNAKAETQQQDTSPPDDSGSNSGGGDVFLQSVTWADQRDLMNQTLKRPCDLPENLVSKKNKCRKTPSEKRKEGWDGGVVKNKGFYHPNGSPPAQSPPRICVTLTTHTHTYSYPMPPPPPKGNRRSVPAQPLFFTFFPLCYGVFFFVSGMQDGDRVRRSRKAERGGDDNTTVIWRRRRRRWLPSKRAGQRFGSVHLSDVSGTEGGGGGGAPPQPFLIFFPSA
jgi:hypothetical protein